MTLVTARSAKGSIVLLERTFSHFAITVNRIEDALKLYRDVLGFTKVSFTSVTDAPSFREIGLTGATMNMMFLELDGVAIELQEVVQSDGTPVSEQLYPRGLRLIAFRVDNVDIALNRILAGGGSFNRSTMTGSGANAIAFSRDPEGNRVEFVAGDRGGRKPHRILDDDLAGVVPDIIYFDLAVLKVNSVQEQKMFYESHLSMRAEKEVANIQVLSIESMFYGDHLNWRGRNEPGKSQNDLPRLRLRLVAKEESVAGLVGFAFRSVDTAKLQAALLAAGASRCTDSLPGYEVCVSYEKTLFYLGNS